MTRRSNPQSKTDDLAFPVRVKFAVPGSGIRSIQDTLSERMRKLASASSFFVLTHMLKEERLSPIRAPLEGRDRDGNYLRN